MARVILPVQWTGQPGGATPLASLSRFAALPVPCFVYCPSFSKTHELITARNGTPAASEVIAAHLPGMTYKVVRQTSGGLDFGVFQPIQSAAYTIIALCNGGSADGVSTVFSQRDNAGVQIDFVLNSDTALGSVPGAFMCLSQGATSQNTRSTATTYVNGAFHTFGVTSASISSNPVLWYDGLSIAGTSDGAGTGSPVNASQQTRLGNIGNYTTDGAFCAANNIALVAVFNYTLPNGWMQILMQNPWLIFSNRPTKLWIDSEMLDQPTIKRVHDETVVQNKAKISAKHSFIGWQQTPLALDNSVSTSARQFILPILQRNRGPLHQSWLSNPLAADNSLAVSARTFDLPLVSPRRFAQYVWQLSPLSANALTFSIPLSAMTTYANPQLRPANRFIFDATTTPRPDDAIIISPSGGVWRPVFMPRRR